MRTIDIGIEKIDKIYHIADVHVRNVKRHKEYQLVFKRLYSYITTSALIRNVMPLKIVNTKNARKIFVIGLRSKNTLLIYLFTTEIVKSIPNIEKYRTDMDQAAG